MKAIGACILALALLASLATLVAPPRDAQADEVYEPFKKMWATKRANVRAGPSTNYDKIDLLEVGKLALVVSKRGSWYKLLPRPRQKQRYVYAPLLTEVEPTKSHTAVSASTVKTINYGNGDRYRGQMRNGRRHGRGVYTWASGGSYDGEWLNGHFHGHGVRIYSNGNRYEGDYVNGKRSGGGVFTWPNGNRYEGDFVKGKRTGRGIFTWADGHRYEGDFVDGKFTGRGRFKSANKNTVYESYEGDYVDNKFHGHGVAVQTNGNRYEGEFKKGKLHGKGTFFYADGTRIAGNFADGEPYHFATSRQLRNAKACIDRRGNNRYKNTCRETLLFFYCFTETDGYVETCGRPSVKEARGKPEHYYTHLEYLSPGEMHKVPFGDDFPFRWAVCPQTGNGVPYIAISGGNNRYKCRTHWRHFSNNKSAEASKLTRREKKLERQHKQERVGASTQTRLGAAKGGMAAPRRGIPSRNGTGKSRKLEQFQQRATEYVEHVADAAGPRQWRRE